MFCGLNIPQLSQVTEKRLWSRRLKPALSPSLCRATLQSAKGTHSPSASLPILTHTHTETPQCVQDLKMLSEKLWIRCPKRNCIDTENFCTARWWSSPLLAFEITVLTWKCLGWLPKFIWHFLLLAALTDCPLQQTRLPPAGNCTSGKLPLAHISVQWIWDRLMAIINHRTFRTKFCPCGWPRLPAHSH